jgi:hypothetical protein
MSKFALADKDFDTVKGGIPKTGKTFELLKLSKDEYILFEHIGNHAGEVASFTYNELKVLWMMLTIK